MENIEIIFYITIFSLCAYILFYLSIIMGKTRKFMYQNVTFIVIWIQNLVALNVAYTISTLMTALIVLSNIGYVFLLLAYSRIQGRRKRVEEEGLLNKTIGLILMPILAITGKKRITELIEEYTSIVGCIAVYVIVRYLILGV